MSRRDRNLTLIPHIKTPVWVDMTSVIALSPTEDGGTAITLQGAPERIYTLVSMSTVLEIWRENT